MAILILYVHYGNQIINLAHAANRGVSIESALLYYTRQGRSPYSVIFLARIACCYVVFELSTSMLEQAQALLVDYFIHPGSGL